MPQKKAKAKPEKSKKPAPKPAARAKAAKPSKPVGLGAALKRAAKNVAKSVGLSSSKKSPPPVKKGKGGAAKKAAPLVAKGKKALPPILPKGKKEAPKGSPKAALKVVPAKGEGKSGKKTEVVVEVPAPKGVALLTKEGKGKKSKAAAESAAKLKRCREPGCDHDFTIHGYCRLHYIKNWRRIKRKEAILASGQLNNYVEELVNKYPDKYLDVIRQDLATEKEWGKVVVDLELEGTDEESGAEEDIDAAAEGVRAPVGGARGEFDDEGDAF